MTHTDALDPATLQPWLDAIWEETIVPALTEYIAIPAKSPAFDADWAANGHIDAAVDLIVERCRRIAPDGMGFEVVRLEGRTPVILMELPAAEGCEQLAPVLLYGHMDKQPEMEGWDDDLGPWKPVRKGERLYGRGGGDDGYAAFASTLALAAMVRTGVPRPRAVVLIEGCEESGSYDLPHYIEHLAERIGSPELVVCLDSGAGDYERLWNTTSLRGLVAGDLTVSLLREGVHSGDASGIVPDSFRVARALLSRVEDPATGRIADDFHVAIPAARRTQAEDVGVVLGDAIAGKYPFQPDAHGVPGAPADLVLARTWEPALSITGADGLPALADAGNVSRPRTSLKLSLRIPPTLDPAAATARLKRLLEADPPYGAVVTFEPEHDGPGWEAPELAPWLAGALDEVGQRWFGAPTAHMGEGGSIPFMGMLSERFPAAQFLITGVLGPGSNAHGPNEFLHLGVAKKLTGCVAEVLVRYATRD